MELATIGAALGFALEAERQTLKVIENLLAGQDEPSKGLAAWKDAKIKHLKILEQTRRENTTEMILEPIRGLFDSDFPFPDGSTTGEGISLVALREGVAVKYLLKAAEVIPQRDVSRILRKIAREKETHLGALTTVDP
jgi:rubrerythrin